MKFVFLFRYFLLIFIIIAFSYINSQSIGENFTPYMREFYRPIVRKTRIVGEGFYNKMSQNAENVLRKFKIL